ncbi:MAG: glycosyltransferase family 2 protein [Erythrobacter sp.]|uniref:glycosyltransferase n=1 Tax=Erythrobacter sp. TaxID=1042 RepID=UPI003267114E
MTRLAQFTLIIPAHNEESVIGRCLRSVLTGMPANHAVEIIVAANGCTDSTVHRAREACPSATILDILPGSKTNAINAANRIARFFPRIILDADVECSFQSLAALAEAHVQPDVMVSAPAIRLDQEQGSFLIKSYYRAWMKQPYAKAGKGGAGCYCLSQHALKTVGEFPEIFGDDIWIHTRFADTQRRYVRKDRHGQDVYSVVRPPRTVRDQIRVEVRRAIGNAEVREKYPSRYLADVNSKGGVKGVLKSGASPLDLLVFIGVKFVVKLRARLQVRRSDRIIWARDNSTREL